MRRIAALSALAVLALAVPTADAATPRKVAGVKLTWPSKTSFKPGEKVTLRVRSAHRRASVAFLAGHKVLARKSLRHGTFRMTVPSPAGPTYTLRATVARKSYVKQIKTVACTGDTGTLTASAAAGRPGIPVKFTITNTGSECMSVPSGPLRWVAPDGSTVNLDAYGNVRRPDDGSILTPAPDRALQPGESYVLDGHVPERLADGRYTVQVQTAPGVAGVPFDVSVCLGGPQAPASDQRLQLGATSVPAGGKLPYTLVNAGSGCVLTGVGYSLERQEADGSFTRVNTNEIFITIGLMLGPGKAYKGTANIPADATPGTYRLTHGGASATFTVTLP
jgi:hypothetical protein